MKDRELSSTYSAARIAAVCRRALTGALALCLIVPSAAQESPQGQRPEPAQQSGERRPAVRPPSDWASENFDLVAASPEQIEEVLKKDAGLMVELKRLVAREASDNGQIIEEYDLSDRGVSERLRRDVRFRSKATRLLERYGYLVPQLNPQSPQGAEQNLILKERAERLARISAESERNRERNEAVCSNLDASECGPERQPAPQRTLARDRNRVEQTEEDLPASGAATEGLAPRAGEAPRSAPGLTETGLTETGIAPRRGATRPNRRTLFEGGEAWNPSAAMPSVLPEPPSRGARRGAGAPGAGEMRPFEPRRNTQPADSEPVELVRTANPYAEIPSLYDLYVKAAPRTGKLERFGLEAFRREPSNPDSIPMDLPMGPDYVLGPGDGLTIDLWGAVSQRLFRTVDREGRLSLPEAGPLLVSGRTLGDVQQAVQRALRTQYRDVSADVSLLRLRTVRVYVVGEVVSPGAYDISSLSTPLNALVAAGGVTSRGSLRLLRHLRGKQAVEEVDAYDLLLRGVRGELKNLENGDTLLVPPVGAQIAVDGMVRRPALYELRGEKNLAEILDLAGGILPAAALRHIQVERLEAHDKRTMLSLALGETSDAEAIRRELAGFAVRDGDQVHIFPIAPYNSATVYLEGHVLRPGRYAHREGMRLTDLVASYADLLPEPAEGYAEIVRLRQPDSRPAVESFSLAAALKNPEASPKLEALDTVRIFSRYDFEAAPTVWLTGEVRAPGQYRTSGQIHLRDAIHQAGGLTPDAAPDSAQLFRSQSDGSLRILSVYLTAALSGDPLENILLQPRDRIVVQRSAYRVDPPTVYVKGEVAKPGRYPLATNMRVSDLMHAAGGLLRSANPEGGDLTHYAVPGAASGAPVPAGHESVNLTAALAGSSDQDFPLHGGDVLTVPQVAGWNDIGAQVTLRGEVRKPGVYGIRSGERLSSLLKRAGGLLPTAYPRAAVFERNEVRELQQKSRQELIQRLEQESTLVKTSVTTTGTEEAALQQAALQQRQRMLEGLRNAPVSGRLVIYLRFDRKGFEGSPDDIELRAGDLLSVPKQPGAVIVVGQVYNSNAITYLPGRNAGWYLSRAGGATQLADKGAIFIIRADGSVTGGKQGGRWSGGALSSAVGPGDTIVVPEKPILGKNTWRNVLAIAQIAQAGALAAAVAIP